MKFNGYWEKYKVLSAILLFFFALFLVGRLLYTFGISIQKNQAAIGTERLKEVAIQNSSYVSNIMSDYADYTNALANSFSTYDDLSDRSLRKILSEVVKGSQFQQMSLDLLDGRTFTSDGLSIYITDDEYLKRVLGGKSFITYLRGYNQNQPFISVVSPIIRDEVVLGAIRGIVQPQKISHVLNVTIFNGNGYFCLINGFGDVLAQPQNDNTLLGFDNYFETLISLEFDNGYSAQKVIDDIKSGKSDLTAYSYNGSQRYAYYVPVGISDWYMVIMVPQYCINENAGIIQSGVVALIVKAFIVLALLFAFILYSIKISGDAIAKMNKELRMGEERYRFILERSDSVIFEYTISNNSVEFSDKYEKTFGKTMPQTGIPYSAINSADIHKDDANTFTNIFNYIREGKTGSNGEVRILDGNGKYIWCLITLVTIFDENDIPVKALGIIENINEKKELEEKYKEAQLYKDTLISENSVIYEVDLSKNIFINGYNEILSIMNTDCENNFREISKLIARLFVTDEYRHDYLESNSARNLITMYNSGITETTNEYQTQNAEGEISWSRIKYKLYQNPSTKNICAMVSMTDISEQKLKELKLIELSQKDPLTGLYNKITTENLIKETLLAGVEGIKHALFIVDVDNFKTVNDSLGHLCGDTVLIELADKLKPLFRSDDIVGRIGGDEFFVFLRSFHSIDIVKLRAKEICNLFRRTYNQDGKTCSVSASIGIAIAPEHGLDFETLYKNADTALYITKQKGKNNFTVYDGSEFAGYKSNRE